MTIATREALLQPAKRRFREVPLPISGHRVRIRSLTQLEREQYQAAIFNDDQVRSDAERQLVVRCLADEEGNLMLEQGDVKALRELDSADTAVLYDACLSHTGMKARDIEKLVGNSGSGTVVDAESVPPKPADDSVTSTPSSTD